MLVRLSHLLVLIALTVGALVLPAPANAATAAQQYASTAHKVTNKVRVNHDRKALRSHKCLKRAAVRQAKKMAGKENIFHQLLGPILDGCLLSYVGENVAYGYATGGAVVRKGWMKSPGHRKNILDKGFTRMGIAARKSDDGTWYVAQVFGKPLLGK